MEDGSSITKKTLEEASLVIWTKNNGVQNKVEIEEKYKVIVSKLVSQNHGHKKYKKKEQVRKDFLIFI